MRRVVLAVVMLLAALSAATANAKVLRVGTYHGKRGQFRSIQAAVNAAHPGDWILIAPGDYKEHSGQTPAGLPNRPGACS
jgi:pectin methylesterase-like acyl-CoA thioesterase